MISYNLNRQQKLTFDVFGWVAVVSSVCFLCLLRIILAVNAIIHYTKPNLQNRSLAEHCRCGTFPEIWDVFTDQYL